MSQKAPLRKAGLASRGWSSVRCGKWKSGQSATFRRRRPPPHSTEKLVPQPQADLAWGFRTAKWLPISSSV